jgi:hypothetical protein
MDGGLVCVVDVLLVSEGEDTVGVIELVAGDSSIVDRMSSSLLLS